MVVSEEVASRFVKKFVVPVNRFESTSNVDEAELPDAPIHTPLTAKHPPVRLMPFDPVDVAVQFNRSAERPPVNVEVEPPVTVRLIAVDVPSDTPARS